MTLQEAISNLKIHQQWRLGADIIMIEPKELTESIDIILAQLPQQEICINCDEEKETHEICMDCIGKLIKENQKELSDEEIEKGAREWYNKEGAYSASAIALKTWIYAIRWYREQLKQRQ
jgi:ribosomal protein L32